jgi:hypothetical protein
MKLRRKALVHAPLFFSIAFFLTSPARSQQSAAVGQRASIGVDLGETSDKFGGLARNTAAEGVVEGQFTFLQYADKGGPNFVAGGEIRVPSDTSAHATEFALYGGPEFWFGKHFMAGVHLTARKLYVPSSEINGLFFTRYKMLLLELPVVMQYKFGPGMHAFVEAQVSPEFNPHYTNPVQAPSSPHPNLDHGYTIRGSVGYNFGKWYAKATYQTRYFNFTSNTNNPNDLYNWRTDVVTGGVGLTF